MELNPTPISEETLDREPAFETHQFRTQFSQTFRSQS